VLKRTITLFFLILAALPMALDATEQAPAGVLIFGGTRGTGLEVAKLLTANGEPVTVFVRPSSDRSAVEPLGVDFVVGDALNEGDVNAAFVDKNYRAVISTIGCFKCEVPPDYLGNKNIFDAARAANIPRVILVSSIGAGDSADAPPWISKWFLKDVMALKTQAEDHLRSTGVGYTIVRPGGLKDGDPTGNGLLTEDVDAMGIITRADLAKLMVDALDDPAAANKVYSAMDSELTWPWGMWD
jgi:uncharacterized protein YbjT (DUF2867 family)